MLLAGCGNNNDKEKEREQLKKLLELQFSTVNNDFFINVELVILTNVASRIRKFKEALALISLYLEKKMKILHF